MSTRLGLACVVLAAVLRTTGLASAQETRLFAESLVDGRGYLHDSLTIPFDLPLEGQELDPVLPVGIRLLTELQLSLVAAPFQPQPVPGFGLELAAFRGWIDLTLFVMPAPFQVHFSPGTNYLFNDPTADGGADVRVKYGVFVGLTFFFGVISMGPVWLSMDADSFRTATSDPLYTAFLFSLNPVAIARLFGGAALATGEPRSSQRDEAQDDPPEPWLPPPDVVTPEPVLAVPVEEVPPPVTVPPSEPTQPAEPAESGGVEPNGWKS